MPTTSAMTGLISTSSAAPTLVVMAALNTHLQLVCSDTGSSPGTVSYAVDSEAVNASTNSNVPASGIATPIVKTSGIGTLTLYQSAGASVASYWLSAFKRSS